MPKSKYHVCVMKNDDELDGPIECCILHYIYIFIYIQMGKHSHFTLRRGSSTKCMGNGTSSCRRTSSIPGCHGHV